MMQPQWRHAALACGAGLLAGAASACTPVPWDTVGGVAQLPPEVQTLLLKDGAMADPGWPFNTGFGSETTQPMRRLILAVVGTDCVRADFEQNARGIARYTALYQLIDGHWKQVGDTTTLFNPPSRLLQQISLGGATYP